MMNKIKKTQIKGTKDHDSLTTNEFQEFVSVRIQ